MSLYRLFFGSKKGQPTSLADVAAEISAGINDLRVGSFCFWGIWFGRPHDNYHKAISVESGDDFLRFAFNNEERLTIWQPENYVFDASQFVVHSASRVLWEWFYYGRPHTTGNLMHYDLRKSGLSIAFTSNFHSASAEQPNSLAPAVLIQ